MILSQLFKHEIMPDQVHDHLKAQSIALVRHKEDKPQCPMMFTGLESESILFLKEVWKYHCPIT